MVHGKLSSSNDTESLAVAKTSILRSKDKALLLRLVPARGPLLNVRPATSVNRTATQPVGKIRKIKVSFGISKKGKPGMEKIPSRLREKQNVRF